MAERKLGITMELGASLGSTFKSTFGGAESRIKDLGSSIREMRSEPTHKLMQSFYKLRDGVRTSRKELSAAEKNLAELKEQAEAAGGAKGVLARRIEMAEGKVKSLRSTVERSTRQFVDHKAKIADTGRDLGELSSEYRHLTSEMDKAKSKMDRLNNAMEASGNIREQIGSAARVTAGITAGVGAVGAAVTMMNKATGEQIALAKSLGVSADTFQAWGGVAREAGFDVDHVGDLIEEMNNKLGESAGLEETTPVKEALQMIGLSFQDLQDLKPEEQFRQIAKAIKAMPDGQQASSAADILMGGEANKFFGYLRSRQEGVDEILAQQKRLNALSEEGRAGAAAYNTAFSQLATVFSSVTAEVSGLIGGALAPLVEEYAPKLADWVKSHKEDLVGIGDSVKASIPAILSFGRGLYSVFSTVGAAIGGVVGLMGGWENAAIALGLVMGGRLALGVARFGMNVFTIGKAIVPMVSTHLPALAGGITSTGLASAWTTVKTNVMAAAQKAWAVGQAVVVTASRAATVAIRTIGSASMWSAVKMTALGAAQKAWAVGQAVVTGACTAIGTAFRVMGMAVMANPIGLIIGGIAIGAALLISNWGKVKTFFVEVWTSVVKAFTWAWEKIKELPLVGVLMEGASAIGSIVSSVGSAIGSFFGGEEKETAERTAPAPGATVENSPTYETSNTYSSTTATPGQTVQPSYVNSQTTNVTANNYTSPSPTSRSTPESQGRLSQMDRAVKSIPPRQTITFNQTVNVNGGASAGDVKSAVSKANEGLEARVRKVVAEMFQERERTAYA